MFKKLDEGFRHSLSHGVVRQFDELLLVLFDIICDSFVNVNFPVVVVFFTLLGYFVFKADKKHIKYVEELLLDMIF